MILLLNVLHYHFIRHITTAATKVPARPDMSPPELLLQVRDLLKQFVGCLPFQPLQQSADRNLRRYADKQMNVVARDVPFHNRHFVSSAYLSNQVSDSEADFASENWTPVFGRPDNVQMNLEDGMRTTQVIFHAATLAWQANLLKPSPKGEGFDPPRVRQ
jgi:hypothetical protein